MFKGEQTPQVETAENAAVLLGLSADATPEQIVAKYNEMVEGDKRTSEWDAERSILDELQIPAWVDRLVADLKDTMTVGKEESGSRTPSMMQVAEVLQNLGFNVTENDPELMRQAVQELIDGNDDGIHSLPVGTEKALGM